MKLLFDQNISFRITRLLKPDFPNCKHINDVGLNEKSDTEIWNFANLHDFVIVTFDADFYDLAVVKGVPPKIIWLRTGNATTLNIAHMLIKNKQLISDFCLRSNKSICLEIT